MVLHDTESCIVEVETATESLPDPTSVAGRMHRIFNTSLATAVWSSVGATPFTDAGGVNVATVSVPAGSSLQIQSDGVRWVVKDGVPSRRVFAGSGVSDGSGNVVFTFTPPFAAAPRVTQAVETTNTNATEARVTALSASSCTVNVRQSPGVVILGISVLQVPQPLVGATVHLHAVEAGQGV